MADLNFKERRILEHLFVMSDGYVLDFSNRTMQEFIIDCMGVDIYSEKYSIKGESKANRLRGFWEIESNYHVGQLVEQLVEYWMSQVNTGEIDYDYHNEKLHKQCLTIIDRLKSGGPVESLDSIKPNSEDKSFEKLSIEIRNSINNNNPENGIDRLHTFTTKYLRELCSKHGIGYEKSTPLHSLFGMYVKYLKSSELIESEMTSRILKSSISVLEAYNQVRNEQSFAHANTILNYDESLLIFNDIANIIRFIQSIEKQNDDEDVKPKEEEWDLPF